MEYLSAAARVEHMDPRVQKELHWAQSEVGLSCSGDPEIQAHKPVQEDEERVLVGICVWNPKF